MREIKFRAWNGHQMVIPDYIHRDGYAQWTEGSIPTSTSGKPIYTEMEVIGNIYENPEL